MTGQTFWLAGNNGFENLTDEADEWCVLATKNHQGKKIYHGICRNGTHGAPRTQIAPSPVSWSSSWSLEQSLRMANSPLGPPDVKSLWGESLGASQQVHIEEILNMLMTPLRTTKLPISSAKPSTCSLRRPKRSTGPRLIFSMLVMDLLVDSHPCPFSLPFNIFKQQCPT